MPIPRLYIGNHIGLTRQVTQYFESRGELQTLLEEIFSGSTPEHPSEDALERELEQFTADIIKVKADFERHRAAKNEFKEIRRYVDIWNESIEKQIATNPKDASKPLKKLVPFFSGPKPPSYTKVADAHMVTARGLVPTLEDIGMLSDIKMDTANDTSNELIIYTAKFKDAYNSLSHTLEVLHKKSRVLKKKKNQCIEKLFSERCRIFSVELQAHYRSIGESLAGGSGSIAGESSAVDGSGAGTGVLSSSPGATTTLSSGRLVMHRHHVEGNMEAYSSEGSSLGGYHSQELLLDTEELPSYFQHQQSTPHSQLHRRTGSLGSPAHSSSASSSISLNSPYPGVTVGATILDSPPDYVRDESAAVLTNTTYTAMDMSGPVAVAADEEEDALFRAYRQRYDTRERQNSDPRSRPMTTTTTRSRAGTGSLDTPPGYDETRYHTVVDPV
ncbi:hypothetical protein EC957_009034 [Mortierella hygrophila]|uniref:Uncharacterized protein n=1 Tax=Mortierella hygrophila TaxID=979708 RepID=A0A9P6JXW5_9FUNG|nr:hypothetical protein EC957_009034 [Mortierella hygrophila]